MDSRASSSRNSEGGRLSGIVALRRSIRDDSSSSSSSSSIEEFSDGTDSGTSSSSVSTVASDPSKILDQKSDVSSIRDMPSRISGRGALIGGVHIPPEQQEEVVPSEEDLESGVEPPPDSDYVPDYRAPATLFPVSDENENKNSPSRQRNDSKFQSSWMNKSKLSGGPPSSTSRSSDDSKKKNFERFADEVSPSSTKHPRLWYVLGGVSVLLLGAVIAVAVIVAGQGDSMTSQQQVLSDLAKEISSEADLENKSSPQSQAYDWLVFQDDTWAGVEEIPRDIAVQRYVLAVFYFSTSGPSTWQVKGNWLQGNECVDEWTGVSCNDQGEVRTVALGKLLELCMLGGLVHRLNTTVVLTRAPTSASIFDMQKTTVWSAQYLWK